MCPHTSLTKTDAFSETSLTFQNKSRNTFLGEFIYTMCCPHIWTPPSHPLFQLTLHLSENPKVAGKPRRAERRSTESS
ncbi:hypothetical protein HanIR_Chr13g0626821 [Helianthus annuus]|nr:hypothetical protein HanIR_Chr13g0626821 [Helianthus annuus]